MQPVLSVKMSTEGKESLQEKLERMKIKNEALRKRYMEVEADKRKAASHKSLVQTASKHIPNENENFKLKDAVPFDRREMDSTSNRKFTHDRGRIFRQNEGRFEERHDEQRRDRGRGRGAHNKNTQWPWKEEGGGVNGASRKEFSRKRMSDNTGRHVPQLRVEVSDKGRQVDISTPLRQEPMAQNWRSTEIPNRRSRTVDTSAFPSEVSTIPVESSDLEVPFQDFATLESLEESGEFKPFDVPLRPAVEQTSPTFSVPVQEAPPDVLDISNIDFSVPPPNYNAKPPVATLVPTQALQICQSFATSPHLKQTNLPGPGSGTKDEGRSPRAIRGAGYNMNKGTPLFGMEITFDNVKPFHDRGTSAANVFYNEEPIDLIGNNGVGLPSQIGQDDFRNVDVFESQVFPVAAMCLQDYGVPYGQVRQDENNDLLDNRRASSHQTRDMFCRPDNFEKEFMFQPQQANAPGCREPSQGDIFPLAQELSSMQSAQILHPDTLTSSVAAIENYSRTSMTAAKPDNPMPDFSKFSAGVHHFSGQLTASDLATMRTKSGDRAHLGSSRNYRSMENEGRTIISNQSAGPLQARTAGYCPNGAGSQSFSPKHGTTAPSYRTPGNESTRATEGSRRASSDQPVSTGQSRLLTRMSNIAASHVSSFESGMHSTPENSRTRKFHKGQQPFRNWNQDKTDSSPFAKGPRSDAEGKWFNSPRQADKSRQYQHEREGHKRARERDFLGDNENRRNDDQTSRSQSGFDHFNQPKTWAAFSSRDSAEGGGSSWQSWKSRTRDGQATARKNVGPPLSQRTNEKWREKPSGGSDGSWEDLSDEGDRARTKKTPNVSKERKNIASHFGAEDVRELDKRLRSQNLNKNENRLPETVTNAPQPQADVNFAALHFTTWSQDDSNVGSIQSEEECVSQPEARERLSRGNSVDREEITSEGPDEDAEKDSTKPVPRFEKEENVVVDAVKDIEKHQLKKEGEMSTEEPGTSILCDNVENVNEEMSEEKLSGEAVDKESHLANAAKETTRESERNEADIAVIHLDLEEPTELEPEMVLDKTENELDVEQPQQVTEQCVIEEENNCPTVLGKNEEFKECLGESQESAVENRTDVQSTEETEREIDRSQETAAKAEEHLVGENSSVDPEKKAETSTKNEEEGSPDEWSSGEWETDSDSG